MLKNCNNLCFLKYCLLGNEPDGKTTEMKEFFSLCGINYWPCSVSSFGWDSTKRHLHCDDILMELNGFFLYLEHDRTVLKVWHQVLMSLPLENKQGVEEWRGFCASRPA